jgi:hypothetical protein
MLRFHICVLIAMYLLRRWTPSGKIVLYQQFEAMRRRKLYKEIILVLRIDQHIKEQIHPPLYILTIAIRSNKLA